MEEKKLAILCDGIAVDVLVELDHVLIRRLQAMIRDYGLHEYIFAHSRSVGPDREPANRQVKILGRYGVLEARSAPCRVFRCSPIVGIVRFSKKGNTFKRQSSATSPERLIHHAVDYRVLGISENNFVTFIAQEIDGETRGHKNWSRHLRMNCGQGNGISCDEKVTPRINSPCGSVNAML